MRIGIHTSIAGSLENAARKAAKLGANTFQIFSASPRTWKVRPLEAEPVRRLRRARQELDLVPLAIHDNYLINLAAADETLRCKSVAAFRGELLRAMMIGAEYVVAHPGNYRGRTLEDGLRRVVRSLAEAVKGLRTDGLTLLIENTAGAGSALGSRFEELAEIRRLAIRRTDLEIGYCLDTAHCLAAGYDVATAKGLRQMIKEAEAVLGLDHVRLIHANDSKAPLASRVDRHEHIGKGYIGEDGFRRILRHPKLRRKPFILETPIDKDGDDARNMEKLKQLCRKNPTTIS